METSKAQHLLSSFEAYIIPDKLGQYHGYWCPEY